FYCPVPERGTNCGLPPPLSVTETFAVRPPPSSGVNVTWKVQLAPGARPVGQLLLPLTTAKSPEFVPEIRMLVICIVPVAATFLRVIVVGALVVPALCVPKFTLGGVRLAAVPVPVRLTVCGLPGALSLNDSVPVRRPLVVGLNWTSTVQLLL